MKGNREGKKQRIFKNITNNLRQTKLQKRDLLMRWLDQKNRKHKEFRMVNGDKKKRPDFN